MVKWGDIDERRALFVLVLLNFPSVSYLILILDVGFFLSFVSDHFLSAATATYAFSARSLNLD